LAVAYELWLILAATLRKLLTRLIELGRKWFRTCGHVHQVQVDVLSVLNKWGNLNFVCGP